MKSSEMKVLTPYRISKPSSDNLLCEGLLIWLSKNGDLNVVDQGGGGFLLNNEWNVPGGNDFEVEEDKSYYIAKYGNREMIIRNKTDSVEVKINNGDKHGI